MTSQGLTLANVTKRYGATTILRGIDLEVAAGEMLVLVGPSGSGKSTLLRIIGGLVPQDEGRIFVDGRDVSRLAPHERDIAMVFQSYALFPHMTVAQNLSFGMEARREPAARIALRVADVARTLGIDRLLGRYPRELSGGERQRVALGRAMVREPKLFLMDEPLSNLDAQLRVHMRAELVRLHARLQTTTVFVTHDQIEALSMGNRVGVLRDGALEQIGTARELYHHPRSLFVATFIGTPAMNTFQVVSDEQGLLWGEHRIAMGRTIRPGVWTAGLRPEHIYLKGSRWAVDDATPGELQGTVEVVEMAGDQNFIEVNVQGEILVARTEPDFEVRAGDVVELWFDRARIHLFDPQTELAET